MSEQPPAPTAPSAAEEIASKAVQEAEAAAASEAADKATADKVVAAAMAAIGDKVAREEAAAAADASNDDSTSNLSGDLKASKRKERLEQNRISARESRKRKKTMIEELQRTVITLSRENKDLNDRNEQLRGQLIELGSKVSRRVLCCVLLSVALFFISLCAHFLTLFSLSLSLYTPI